MLKQNKEFKQAFKAKMETLKTDNVEIHLSRLDSVETFLQQVLAKMEMV